MHDKPVFSKWLCPSLSFPREGKSSTPVPSTEGAIGGGVRGERTSGLRRARSAFVVGCGKIASGVRKFGHLQERPFPRKCVAFKIEATRFHAITH